MIRGPDADYVGVCFDVGGTRELGKLGDLGKLGKRQANREARDALETRRAWLACDDSDAGVDEMM